MIKYDKLWVTMKERGISQYKLYQDYGIDRSLLNRLRHNLNIEVYTLDRLCTILKCDIGDIVEHVPDNEDASKDLPKENTPVDRF